MLRGVDCWFFTDISGQPVSPIFKGQAVQEECIFVLIRQRENRIFVAIIVALWLCRIYFNEGTNGTIL
jgi:hypothetical protein